MDQDAKCAADKARALLLSERHGILSTISVEMAGYPFGSVVPYGLDESGRAIILISLIAQHFKNIQSNPKVSLTILEGGEGDVQAKGRLTYIANALSVPQSDQNVAERYARYYPQAKAFELAHNFRFFRLEPVRFRFIGGFGEIDWIEPSDLTRKNPFGPAEEKRILDHMNQDHAPALKHYCRHFLKLEIGEKEPVTMIGIDGEGFDVLVKGNGHRLTFSQNITNTQEARQVLVAMATSPTT